MSAKLDHESFIDNVDYEEGDHKDSVTPQEVVNKIAKGGEEIVIQWHNKILKEPPKFDAFLKRTNMLKNRYPNVILYDRSRVKLVNDKFGDGYYHASYVDSYDRSDGYILAQAPFDETTESDFWRMTAQTGTKLIVLLTDVDDHEGNRLIKHFWPEPNANNRVYTKANIKVNCIKNEITTLYDWYKFSISNIADERANTILVAMIHYRKWMYDKIIPNNLLEFRSEVTAVIFQWESGMAKNGYTGPICLLCPTGVHRSGTYAVLDIVLDRVTAEKKVGLLETASIVRKQRFGCMSYYSHYSHVVDLIVRYAIATGAVDIRRINQKE